MASGGGGASVASGVVPPAPPPAPPPPQPAQPVTEQRTKILDGFREELKNAKALNDKMGRELDKVGLVEARLASKPWGQGPLEYLRKELKGQRDNQKQCLATPRPLPPIRYILSLCAQRQTQFYIDKTYKYEYTYIQCPKMQTISVHVC